nr:hypothetical protein [Methanobrevibacter arboriphilus]
MSKEEYVEHPTEKCPKCNVKLVQCGDLWAYILGNIDAMSFCCPNRCGYSIPYQTNL